MTEDKVIQGVAAMIDREFGIPIYGEAMIQDAEKPCFCVRLLETQEERELGNRYERIFPVVVEYWPTVPTPGAPDAAREECRAVSERLTNTLEHIDAGGQIRGTQRRSKIRTSDDVLQYFVDYICRIEKARDEVKQGSLEMWRDNA